MIVVESSRSATPASSRRRRVPGLRGLTATGILASALTAAATCNAECFTAEYPAKIDYQYQADLVAPISGVVVWQPRIGYSYSPITFDRPKDGVPNYRISDKQTLQVVAFVSNDPSWVQTVIADNEFKSASKLKPDADIMVAWQDKMRMHEDYLFTIQQGQTTNIRWNTEESKDRADRVRAFAKEYTPQLKQFPPAVPFDAKKTSVDLRNAYSDYMRFFELPRLSEAAKNAEVQAELRSRLAEGNRDAGKVTCPIQCKVFESFAPQGRRVNAGDRLASVASIHHKKALITLPANHVALQLAQDETTYDVVLTQSRQQISANTLASLPDDISAEPLHLSGWLVGVPKRAQNGDTVEVEMKLNDTQRNDRAISTLTGDTKIKIIPTEYTKASADARSKIEEKVSKLGLTCQ